MEEKKQSLKMHSTEDALYAAGILVFLIGVAAGIWYLRCFLPGHLDFQCFWRRTTGFFCPGCGGTRAVEALLRGEVLHSFLYYPAVPVGAVLYLGFMISQTAARLTKYRFFKGMPFRLWMPIVILILVIVNFIVKNLLWIIWQISIT